MAFWLKQLQRMPNDTFALMSSVDRSCVHIIQWMTKGPGVRSDEFGKYGLIHAKLNETDSDASESEQHCRKVRFVAQFGHNLSQWRLHPCFLDGKRQTLSC